MEEGIDEGYQSRYLASQPSDLEDDSRAAACGNCYIQILLIFIFYHDIFLNVGFLRLSLTNISQ